MRPEQEPKYAAYAYRDGEVFTSRLYNRATGDVIPDDEPVFVFRARDCHAIKALKFYRDQCADQNHRDIVDDRITDFAKFAATHPDRMKEPDSPA